MKIQNFIFCWKDYVGSACHLEETLSRFGKTSVINSNPAFNYGKWININDGYFAEQWNTLLAFVDDDTDFVFHIQADTVCDYEKFIILFDRFGEIVIQYPIGVYAPNVDYTPCRYDKKDMVELPVKSYHDQKSIFEVVNTDCTCWFINTKLMDRGPLFDLSINPLGWGADFYYAAKAALAGYKTVRDFQVTIQHPKKTTYNQDAAGNQFMKWLFTMEPVMFWQMSQLVNVYTRIAVQTFRETSLQ